MSGSSVNWKFRPHPLLFNGHLQSLVGIYWPRRDAAYKAVQHHVPLEDGDQLVLHEDQPDESQAAGQPNVLLIHGLAGCHQSTYMCRMADRLAERGFRVFRMDMRGCGAGQSLARRTTHCGRWGDAAAAIEYITEQYPDTPIRAVGFSMGGSLLLNMLAETGETPVGRLQRTLAICSPIDLQATERGFRSSWGRWYDRFFVRLIWRQAIQRWQYFPDLAPPTIPRRPRRLRDIDEVITAPIGGFESAEDYYRKTAPGPRLTLIRQPATILSAQDDPIIPSGPLGQYKLSDSVELVMTQSGGHLGYLGHANGDPDFRWLDWRIIDWLKD